MRPHDAILHAIFHLRFSELKSDFLQLICTTYSYLFQTVHRRRAKTEANKRLFEFLPEILDGGTVDNTDVPTDVVIVPPDADEATDEEEESENPESLPVDVAGTVEVFYHEDMNPFEVTSKTWKDGEMNMKENFEHMRALEAFEDLFPMLSNKTPVELFEMFFNNEIIDLIVRETNRYAQSKNQHNFIFSKRDLLSFICIVFLSGYNKRPQEWMYWSKEKDIECPIISSILSSKNFKKIKSNIHFADNNSLNKEDKFSKIRPLLILVNQSLQQFGLFSKELCIDEQMIPFYGRHSCKMFIKSKPVRFGYKAWILCNSKGYPFSVDLYQGASKKSEGPLSTRVVLDSLKCVQDFNSHELYFDNFFNSHSLLSKLKDMGMRATGTLRTNRTNSCPILDEKTIAKNGRGYSKVWNDGDVQIIQWFDNRSVLVGSNFQGVTPEKNVRRFDKKSKVVRSNVPQPSAIAEYNQNMGGVDLLDNALANLRPTIRSKKWYFCISVNCIRTLLVASWKLSCELGQNYTQLSFVRRVVTGLLDRVAAESNLLRPGPSGPSGKRSLRTYDQGHHIIEPATKQNRCKVCRKNTKMQCKSCLVNLHISCFETFHC